MTSDMGPNGLAHTTLDQIIQLLGPRHCGSQVLWGTWGTHSYPYRTTCPTQPTAHEGQNRLSSVWQSNGSAQKQEREWAQDGCQERCPVGSLSMESQAGQNECLSQKALEFSFYGRLTHILIWVPNLYMLAFCRPIKQEGSGLLPNPIIFLIILWWFLRNGEEVCNQSISQFFQSSRSREKLSAL